MRFSIPVLVLAGWTLLPACLGAQRTAAHSDRYSTVQISQDTIFTAQGQMILEERFILSQFADDPASPLNHLTGHCWGSVVFEGEETAIAAAGGCHMMDSEGSGYYQWWKWEDAGTEGCPIRCGSYGDYNGYGRFTGLTGGGRWTLDAELPGRSVLGRHEGTYEWR